MSAGDDEIVEVGSGEPVVADREPFPGLSLDVRNMDLEFVEVQGKRLTRDKEELAGVVDRNVVEVLDGLWTNPSVSATPKPLILKGFLVFAIHASDTAF